MDLPHLDHHAAASLARFCPHRPTPKQHAFLTATNIEVFFGGAAGGGKSVALLMAALEHVHVPGYAALILRKDTQRLALAGGLIPRSHEWLTGKEEAAWNAARRQWSFQTEGAPATITFGYLATELDKFRYASSEYQLIAFDELTELPEADYLFLFSRLRRAGIVNVPLRMRSASNPGNIGHAWVKQRFVDDPCSKFQVPGSKLDESASTWNFEPGTLNSLSSSDRLFIPSLIADNPHLDAAEYRRSLVHLGPVERERLLSGDWSVQQRGLIRPEWLRYYTLTRSASEADASLRFNVQGSMLSDANATWNLEHGTLNLCAPDGRLVAAVDPAACRRFITVDPAGTSADRAQESRTGRASHTVCQVWDQPRGELSRFLILRDQVRGQLAFGEIKSTLEQLSGRWRPERIWIENEKLGVAMVDQLRHLSVETIPTGGKDKSVRATRLILKFERGEVFLPKYENSWRHDLESELLAWTGHDGEPSDQIDAAAYAAIVAESAGPGIITVQPVVAGKVSG